MNDSAALPIVAVAADAREFSGLLSHAEVCRSLDLPLRFATEATINNRRWLLVANGPGPRLAGLALTHALTLARPAVVVSTGYCGALDNALAIGDVFIATSVYAPEQDFTFRAELPAHSDRTARGVLLSMDRVAVSANEKSALRSTGALVIEMEAAAVARVAASEGFPFFCIRSVSDTAHQDLPLDFNRYRDMDGRFETSRIAAAAMLRPWKLAGLIGFARDAKQASQNLGEFLARCPF